MLKRGTPLLVNTMRDFLKATIREINKPRPVTGTHNLKFHHDNARPNVTQNVTGYLNRVEITIIRNPPYSPDLAPSDFLAIRSKKFR